MEEDFTFFFKASSQGQKAANYILDIDENGVPKFYQHLEIDKNKEQIKPPIKSESTKSTANNKKIKALKLKAKALKLKLLLTK